MLDNDIIQAAIDLADPAGIDPAALLAVIDVESGGRAFARIDGRDEPLIRFEGHYFDRRLSGNRREQARAAGLASPTPGKIANPRSQSARWALFRRAAAIDHKAACESVSWGLGQVMGAHWAWLGYGNVDDLVAEARAGVAGQIRLMLRYVEKAGLTRPLKERDWPTFARGYNGPLYRRHRYDTRLANAYARYRSAGLATARLPGTASPKQDRRGWLKRIAYALRAALGVI
ncbi:N-acetylmuramidase family protein [Mesorhizobium xinjiangense]|uniref:N-acetylmuramidase family protein n=1 Tax=Mesorhizobium xinjiangense TaxID=2678685 RepID=UPI0012EE6773|nr:N-acetylmuramidase family protein [Mesorhizobium xinjiangense]